MNPHYLHIGIRTTPMQVERIKTAYKTFHEDPFRFAKIVEEYLNRNNRARDLEAIDASEIERDKLNEKLAIIDVRPIPEGKLNRNKVRYIESALSRLGRILELDGPMSIIGEFKFMIKTAVSQVQTFESRPAASWEWPFDDAGDLMIDVAVHDLMEAMIPLFETNYSKGRLAIPSEFSDAVAQFEDDWETEVADSAFSELPAAFWDPFRMGEELGFIVEPLGGPVFVTDAATVRTWNSELDISDDEVVVHFAMIEGSHAYPFAPWAFSVKEALTFSDSLSSET